MGIENKPAAEVATDATVVRRLLAEQHPDLLPLPVTAFREGWDNRLYRLGDDLLVRLPRRAAAAPLIEHEQRWLPALSRRLPLPVPAPVRLGRPTRDFPWSWSIVRWFEGDSALATPPHDAAAAAAALDSFLAALHHAAPAEAPINPVRGVALASRSERFHTHVQRLGDLIDRRAAAALWERAVSAPPWSQPPVWIHGDLHPGNLVVRDGRLAAVIDFGDLTAGDPATDLAVLWMVPSALRTALLDRLRRRSAVDDHLLLRARGWALTLGAAYLASSLDDGPMAALGGATMAAALAWE